MSSGATLDLNNLQVAVHRALASWNELDSDAAALLEFLLLVQVARKEMDDGYSPGAIRQATNRVLQSAIDELAEQEAKSADVLRARFIDGETTRRVANRLYASVDQVNRWQRMAITDLSRILLGREMALREERRQRLEAALPPPPYERLFGFDEAQQIVLERLLSPEMVWVVAIVGIGGIGKTSLADAVVRQVIGTPFFEHVVWLRAGTHRVGGTRLAGEQMYEQLLATLVERLWPGTPAVETPADRKRRLRQALRKSPHLIVVDNLEKEADTTYVLEQIRHLVEPSKFLLTSRARPAVSATAFFFSLEELSLADASSLLRYHAESIGLEELVAAGEDEVNAVYDLTGGNPLALKLVTSLAAVLPLPQILADLARSRPGPIEALYRHIYWEAWRTLTPPAQALLQAMPLVAEVGALPEQVLAIGGLSEAEFWPAVTELVARSLLEVQGTVQERRYGIHRLTETFLRTEIIHWPENG